MMKKHAIPLAIVMTSIFGFLVIVTSYSQKSRLVLTGQEMQNKVLSFEYIIDSSRLSQMNDAIIIDLSTTGMTTFASSTNRQNVPLAAILDQDHEDLFSSERQKVLISDNPISTHQAWMLLTQMGYEQLYIWEN